MLYKFRLIGLSPLLMHADDIALSDMLSAWRKDPKNKNFSTPGDDRCPAWTWQTYCYTNGDVLTIPADAIMACLKFAGAQLTLKKQKTFKAETQSGMYVVDEHVPLLVNGKTIAVKSIDAIREKSFIEQCDAVLDLGFRLFMKRAKVGQSKHVRVRARFEKWEVNGQVEVMSESISKDILSQLFEIGGTSYGLLDWRPGSKQSPGPFGRYKAEIAKA